MKNLLNIIKLATIAIILSGCSSAPPKNPYDEMSAQAIYEKGDRLLGKQFYEEAIEAFEALEARYPFGEYADKAQYSAIYAYYKNNDTASTVAAADRFIRMKPTHPKVDYAYYMKGLANFTEAFGFPERYLPVDVAKSDPAYLRAAFKDFSQLLGRYPNSEYANDAKKRMIYLRNVLARHELHIANFYMKRGAYLAAANRANYIVEHYQKTPEVPQALRIMVKAYEKLGLTDLEQSAKQALADNYPS